MCSRFARSFRLALLGILLAGVPYGVAQARLTQQQLSQAGASPSPGARVPTDLRFTDAVSGHAITLGDALARQATILLPVDYTCANVCDPMVSMSAAALRATDLRAGFDYRLVLVGIDPRDPIAAARRMLEQVGSLDREVRGTAALVGDEPVVAALMQAIGYAYVYDAAGDSFAHPAAAMVLTPEGQVARVLSPLGLTGRDLRLALVEASEGRIGTLSDRLALLCYGFDAAKGIYTPLIRRILSIAAALTIVVIALGLFWLVRRERARA